MGQNKIHSNLQNDNININTYCSNCLKLLDGSDSNNNSNNIVKDIDNNFFCDKYCRQDFHRGNNKLLEEIVNC